MSRPLYAPDPERVATSNAWAFMHRATPLRGPSTENPRKDGSGWRDLIAWSAADPDGFAAAVASFAQLPEAPAPLVPEGTTTRLTVLGAAGQLPPEVSAPLARPWPRAALVRPAADVLLHADLRPDDRVLVAGAPSWPWLAALRYGTELVIALRPSPADLFPLTADQQATVLVADATLLPDAAFQRPRARPDLSRLRTIIAIGSPLAPQARARLYAWGKADLLLLARAGDRMWGSAAEPVPLEPGPPLSFFRPPP